MLSQMKWTHRGLAALMVVGLLAKFAWAKGNPHQDPPPEPTGPNIEYQVTWLDLESAFGTPVESIRTHAINDLGDVCGDLRAADKLTPFLFTEETGSLPLDDFALPPDGYSQFRLLTATGINNYRQIVGTALANGLEVAYCLSIALDLDGQILLDVNGDPIRTQAEVLPIPADALWMDAWDVNDRGDIVCNWKDTNGLHAVVFLFVEETGTREAYNVPVVGDVSYPWSINKDGKVAGTCFPGDGSCYALRYDPVTGAIDYLDVPAWGVARSINGEGRVVGQGVFSHYGSVFISEATGTAVTDLGSFLRHSLSDASDINDAEPILASYRDKSGNYPPCLIVPEYGWLELNSLIAPDDQLVWDAWGESKSVDALNNAIVEGGFGQIAGAAFSSSGDVQEGL